VDSGTFLLHQITILCLVDIVQATEALSR